VPASAMTKTKRSGRPSSMSPYIDGRDYSPALDLEPAEWRENTFCTFLIDKS
jgi:hypothetical protein